MRLIDAKALVPRTTSEIGLENYGEVLFVGKSEIDKAPTIDAIPVEWLDDRANDITRAPLFRRYAQQLLDEWQKEQEAR